ncbi:MAG: MCE family protein [Calditrichaeota bacterium]|nr:MCE family protein [Calditrichota bacterium]
MVSSDSDRHIRLGVLLMMALAVFLAGFIFYMVGSTQRLFDRKYSIYMFQPNVEGLLPGAFVTLAGLKIGVVGNLEFAEVDGQQGIRIELKVDRDFQDRITRSSVARIKTMGILGDKYVDISLGYLNDPPLAEGDFIQSVPQLDTDRLLAKAARIVDELEATSRNIKIIAGNLAQGSGALGKLLMDPTMERRLSTVVQRLNLLAGQLVSGKGNLGKLVTDTTLFRTLSRSSRLLEKILADLQAGKGTAGKLLKDDAFFARIDSISRRTDSLLIRLQGDGTAGRLLKDRALYEQLVQLTRSLDALVKDMKANPGKYVTFELF